MQAGTETAAETFFKARLQCVVLRVREVAPEPNDAACRVDARARIGGRAGGTSGAGVSIDRLEKAGPAGADVADFPHGVARQRQPGLLREVVRRRGTTSVADDSSR